MPTWLSSFLSPLISAGVAFAILYINHLRDKNKAEAGDEKTWRQARIDAEKKLGERIDAETRERTKWELESDGDLVAPLVPLWQEWPGLTGCFVYHVPRRLGDTGPYLAICDVAPGVLSEGASLDASRLIALLEGGATANGSPLAVGQVLWIAPGQPLDWQAGPQGFLAAIRYDVPPHDIDPDLFQP